MLMYIRCCHGDQDGDVGDYDDNCGDVNGDKWSMMMMMTRKCFDLKVSFHQRICINGG